MAPPGTSAAGKPRVSPGKNSWDTRSTTVPPRPADGASSAKSNRAARSRRSPRAAGTGRARSSIFHLQDGEKRFLRNLDGADLFHALFARFLLLQQLTLARDVPAIALRQHVLAQRLDRLAGDDIGTDRRLYRHVEHLPGDELAHLDHQLTAAVPRVVAMHD